MILRIGLAIAFGSTVGILVPNLYLSVGLSMLGGLLIGFLNFDQGKKK